MVKILALAGSARAASVNKKLLATAARSAREAGAEVTEVDLRDFPMPLYDGDFEELEGVPEEARRLRELLVEHDGFLFSCPEYNGSITPLLKNTIDWISRPDGDVPGLVAYRGKTAALVSASPGALGGLRGLVHVRAILSGIGVLVVPTQFALGSATDAFDDHGEFENSSLHNRLQAVTAELVRVTTGVSHQAAQ